MGVAPSSIPSYKQCTANDECSVVGDLCCWAKPPGYKGKYKICASSSYTRVPLGIEQYGGFGVDCKEARLE